MKNTKQNVGMSHWIMAFFFTVCMAASLFLPILSDQAEASTSKPISSCGFADLPNETAYQKTSELFGTLPGTERITPEAIGEEKAEIMNADGALKGNTMNRLAASPVTLAASPVTLYVSSTATNDNAVRADGAEYKTVMGAYAKALSGDTIKLKDDITTPDNESRVFYKSIIFDFNGYTMTCSNNVNATYGLCMYSSSSVLTIRDSSTEKTGKMVMQSGAKGEFLTTAVAACNGGKVVIEYCTIVAPKAASLPIYTNFYALQASGYGSPDAGSTAEVTGTLNVEGSWSEESLALKGNLYAISSSSRGITYVRDGAVVNAPGSMIQGNGSPVWFTPGSAKNLVCKGTAGTVAIPLTEDMKLTENLDNGMLSFRVPSKVDATLDLNGFNLSCKQINIIMGGKAKLHIINSSDKQSTITNGNANAHNIINYGDLTIDGKVKILNRSNKSAYACIYQEGDSCPPQYRGEDYELNIAKSVLAKDVILDANYAAMYVDWSYQETSFITINGSTLSSQNTTPMQVPNGSVTINGATFIASQDSSLTPRIEGFFAGTNTNYKIEENSWWFLGNVLLNKFDNVSLAARDNGIYLDERIQSGSNADAAFAFSNIALNKDTKSSAKTGIMNLSGKDITLSGKDTYFVCDELYATQDKYDTGKDEAGKPNPPLGFATPAGTLTITGGIFSVDPSSYVPATDGAKDYAVLDYTNTSVSNYYLVAPWTKVGADNTVSLYYSANAADTDTASDDVSILALKDTENIIADATRVQPRHFTLSSDANTFTAIDGLSVTGFTNGNRLTVQKTKACNATEAYVWYGGRNVGKIIIETKNEPTYDVGGEITGAVGKPTAYLIRDGVKYDATVTGTDNPYEYVVSGVPGGIYNLVVSSATAEDQTKDITTTVLVKIIDHSIAQDVVLPQSVYNSIVTTQGEKTPNVEAGGLDDMAKTVGAPAENNYVLIELKVVENESSDNAGDVRTAITQDGMVKGIIMDTDVLKTVNNNEPEKITEIDENNHGVSLITVVFHLPKNLQGKDGYAIFRYHGTQVDKITEIANSNGEYMEVNAEKDTITAHLNKFSTYSIAYTENYYTVTATAGAGGTISPSDSVSLVENSDKTFTITPDKKYVVSDVLVDGVSVGAVSSYTFKNIQKNHTIKAIFIERAIGTELDKVNHFAYMQGYPTREFGPNRNMTRAEAIVMFSRLLLEKMDTDKSYTSNFRDITGDDWYANAVGYMERFGIISGYPDGTFGGDNPISRAEFAAIATRLDALLLDKQNVFSDVASAHWASGYIAAAAEKGWIAGYPDGTFKPENYITRAEVVTIVNNMLNRKADGAFVRAHKDMVVFTDLQNTEDWYYYDMVESSIGHKYERSANGAELWKSIEK